MVLIICNAEYDLVLFSHEFSIVFREIARVNGRAIRINANGLCAFGIKCAETLVIIPLAGFVVDNQSQIGNAVVNEWRGKVNGRPAVTCIGNVAAKQNRNTFRNGNEVVCIVENGLARVDQIDIEVAGCTIGSVEERHTGNLASLTSHFLNGIDLLRQGIGPIMGRKIRMGFDSISYDDTVHLLEMCHIIGRFRHGHIVRRKVRYRFFFPIFLIVFCPVVEHITWVGRGGDGDGLPIEIQTSTSTYRASFFRIG